MVYFSVSNEGPFDDQLVSSKLDLRFVLKQFSSTDGTCVFNLGVWLLIISWK